MAEHTYGEQVNINNTITLRNLLSDMPQYLKIYFRGIEQVTASRTRIGYARDIRTFFEFLLVTNPTLKDKTLMNITLQVLNNLSAEDIEEYLEYLKYYIKDGREYTNGERSIKRKLCSLRNFFAYLYRNDKIDGNPTVKVAMPKIHDKAIIRMDPNETASFLDNVEYGNKLTEHQLIYHEKTKVRDLALLTLMLGTGIRVSECVGLDINDVDFENGRIKVLRKGGYEAFVYFGDEAMDALIPYMEERKKIEPVTGSENALFLSSQRRRISVRSVELLVKKYSSAVMPLKKITPHKLRSTYGTALYQQTDDIYLVADVLGHKDVNTTKKHYADMDEERKRRARNAVILREN